jgi:hypothetical protein
VVLCQFLHETHWLVFWEFSKNPETGRGFFFFLKNINNYSFQMPAKQSFFDSENFQKPLVILF